MVMQTNSIYRDQLATHIHGNTESVDMNPGYGRTLTVLPSPALRGSGKTHPNNFSFRIFEYQLPKGNTRDFYYWGNPGDRKRAPNYWEGTFSSRYWDSYYYGFPTPLWVENEMNTVRNRCLSKLISKMKTSDIELGTTIGEGRETYELFARLAKSVRHPLEALRSLKRSSRSHFRKNGKFRGAVTLAGSATLQMNLTLGPLMDDIGNIMEHKLVHEWVPGVDETRDDLYNSRTWNGVDARSATKMHWTHAPEATSLWVIERSYRVEMGCQLRIRDADKYEAWRAGLSAGPSLVWELTTLSWLVDYFFSVGKYLEALETAYRDGGFDLRYGYTTETSRLEAKWSTSHPGGPSIDTGAIIGGNVHISGGARGSGYVKERSLQRTTWEKLPTPVYPSIKLPQVSSQLLNCAALLSGFLDKKR